MNKFKIGDKVRRTDCEYDNNRGDVILVGEICTVTAVSDDGKYISVNHITDRDDVYPCSADFFKLVEEVTPSTVQPAAKTGGSTPNQYRISVNLPLTNDRTQFVDVDLEAMDVIDAIDLSGNLKDVQKALFRMGKKQGVDEAYDFNKCLFFILREMKKREIISHVKFWEATQMLSVLLQEDE